MRLGPRGQQRRECFNRTCGRSLLLLEDILSASAELCRFRP
jgi:hypothetical protein